MLPPSSAPWRCVQKECAAPNYFSTLKEGFERIYCSHLQLPEDGFQRNVLPPTSAPWKRASKEYTASIFSFLNISFKGRCCPQLQLPEGGIQRNILLTSSALWKWVSEECAAPNFSSLKEGFEECATSIRNSLNVINNVPLLRWNPSTRLYGC